jgi:hypothetical protein
MYEKWEKKYPNYCNRQLKLQLNTSVSYFLIKFNCLQIFLVSLAEIQRGAKKCTHSLSAAITPDTLAAVFAQQFGGIDAV